MVPNIFKLSRILPLSKPNKKRDDLNSYRPINNLPTLEKIFEQHLLINLQKYLIENKILNNNHHGGRRNHSTTSALLEITNRLNINYDKNMITAVLGTDLTAAYDTVDKYIMILKLKHYGIENNELKLLTNYLTDRKQYVCLDTFSSDIMDSPECSVIQGSKLSGLLYNLYTNEVPLLHKLMDKDLFCQITHDKITKYTNVTHETINFVDDSTSIIAFKDSGQMKKYLEGYYDLIHGYYNINRLKINPDKTTLMVVSKPRFCKHIKNFSFNAKQFMIKAKNSIKILGIYLKRDLKMDAQIGSLCAELHNKIFNIRKLTQFTTFKSRLSFIKSFIIGKLIYAMPTLPRNNKQIN